MNSRLKNERALQEWQERNAIYDEGWWKGSKVTVQRTPGCVDDSMEPCDHDLEVMDHYGDPTGFLWCAKCCGTAEEP